MKKFQLELTDEEVKILQNDLIDIKSWIDGAIAGKINNCMKRAAKQYDELAKAENLESVPVHDHAKVMALMTHPKYKNRVQRDAESVN